MPSSKTLFVLIICFGIVVSVYLFAKNSGGIPLLTQNNEELLIDPYINLGQNADNDWQKILVNVDPNKNTTTILTQNDPAVFDQTTLTAQMSRDFFSQYLLAIKDGPVSTEKSAEIAEKILSIPEYTQTTEAKYIAINLHITTKTDPETLQKYKNALNLALKNRSSQITKDSVSIFQDAISSSNENKITELDPIILSAKSFLTDLLSMEVPQKAVEIHLDLLNASSNLLSDLEALRMVFTDPIKSLLAISQYQKHISSLGIAIGNINLFFSQN